MFEKITDRSADELIKLGWAAITHPDDLTADKKHYDLLLSGQINSYSLDKRYVKPDGSSVWVYLVVAKLNLSDQKEYRHISLIQDISKRKEIENDLIYNNEHDSNTGLYNRRYLETLLRRDNNGISGSRRALIGISLNSLHSLNKIYGFHYTLNLIKRTAEVLGTHADSDRQLFNLYDNQFAFYIKDYGDKSELSAFCASLSDTLKDLLMIERINAGIGILEIKNNTDDIDKLLKCLLIASEKAIISHDDFSFCFFDEKMESEIQREDDIIKELSRISTSDSNDFYLDYQPIVDMNSGRICCFEALARLKSPKLGQISPLEFIPLAEETKIIIPLGYKIIRQALSFLQKLDSMGQGAIGISINISAIQLLRSDFVDKLYQIIRAMNVNPANIILEITESILAVNYEEINTTLGTIKNSGIQIAIDDFGTGYSSLARERELNVNSLKIDKSFIDKLLYLHASNAITGDIISMAHKLGHWVVAEGVEHEAQKTYLASHGCDRIQGFLISRPLDEGSALNLLNQNP